MKHHRVGARPVARHRISGLTVRTEKILLDVTPINGDPNREEFLRCVRASN